MTENRLRLELNTLKLEFGLLQRFDCDYKSNREYKELRKNGQPLPDGIYQAPENNDKFYTIQECGLTEQEIEEYIKLKKLGFLRTIKKCVLFFAVLTIIDLIIIAFLLLFR